MLFCFLSPGSKHNFRQDAPDVATAAPTRATRAKRTSGRLSGCERVSVSHPLSKTLFQQSIPGFLRRHWVLCLCCSPARCARPRCRSPAPPSPPPPPPAPASGGLRPGTTTGGPPTGRPVRAGPARRRRCPTSTRSTSRDSVRHAVDPHVFNTADPSREKVLQHQNRLNKLLHFSCGGIDIFHSFCQKLERVTDSLLTTMQH